MLSICGMNFVAHWAYAEQISSHAEHTQNRFHHMLSMRGNVKKSTITAESNTIFKNLVLQALGTIWFRFLQKKSKKHFMLVYLWLLRCLTHEKMTFLLNAFVHQRLNTINFSLGIKSFPRTTVWDMYNFHSSNHGLQGFVILQIKNVYIWYKNET